MAHCAALVSIWPATLVVANFLFRGSIKTKVTTPNYATGEFGRYVQRELDPYLQERALCDAPRGARLHQADQQPLKLQLYVDKLQDAVQGVPLALAHAGRALCAQYQQRNGK